MRYEDRQTYRRRKIGDALRKFREDLGLTQGAAGRLLDRSQASLSAYENGHRAIRPRDLKYILDMYGVTDEITRDCLLSLAGHGRQSGWWHDFNERLEPSAVDYASLEADAARIRVYETQVVPGLLQSERYARAVIAGSSGGFYDARTVETEVCFRMRRQRLHEQAAPPRISVVLAEGALRQQTGGADVMREQRLKLLAMSELPHIELQVLPFSVESHPGIDGAFCIISVGPDGSLEVATVHSLTRSWYIDEPSDVERHRSAFDGLQKIALSKADSRTLLREIVSVHERATTV